MEEIARKWITEVGFPIFVACLAIYAMYRLFLKNETLSGKIEEICNKSNVALDKNTQATQKLASAQEESNSWWKKFGSDPFKAVCQANALAEKMQADGKRCEAHEASVLLEKVAAAAEKRLAEKAEAEAARIKAVADAAAAQLKVRPV